jgi:hypothetical protein
MKKELINFNHKGVWVEYGDMAAEIDELLAPMIEIIWKLGIKTDESCQGTPTEIYPNNDGWSQIYFHDFEEARKLLVLAFQPTDEEIQAVKEHGLPLCLPFAKWKMSCLPVWKNGQIGFHTSVQFPATTVPSITERLRVVLGEKL